jgi:hypothetical protein
MPWKECSVVDEAEKLLEHSRLPLAWHDQRTVPRQCRGGTVRAALRELAAAARRSGARLCRRAGDGAVAGSAPLSVWLLFVPIGLAEIGDGMSGPAVMAAALSIHPRFAARAIFDGPNAEPCGGVLDGPSS